MEINKIEVKVIEDAVNQVEVIELHELQLLLVGGGSTDVHFC